MDDLLFTGTSRDAVDKFFKEIPALEIKDLVVVNKFLRLRITLDDEVEYVLDQEEPLENTMLRTIFIMALVYTLSFTIAGLVIHSVRSLDLKL